MTLRETLNWGISKLKDAGIGEAETDAWFLLEDITKISKAHFILEERNELSEDSLNAYKSAIEKRSEHIPYQYIVGRQEFMGLTFEVNENVLIPRLDTEVLVEKALEVIKPGGRVLDMCTGSGCILLSVLALGKNLSGLGVDVSRKALEVARTNGKNIFPEASFIESDLFEKVEGKFDAIISNPPYIRTEVIEGLDSEVKNHEPRLALDGFEDGLYFYRKIIEEAGEHLNEGGFLLFEIGYDQGDDVSLLMQKAGFMDIKVIKDLAGLDRVVSGHL